MKKQELVVYTDGASRGNPGPGGWAAVILAGEEVREIAAGVERATNNQMELQAVLSVLRDKGCRGWKGPISVFSDSAYVVNGLNAWVYGWAKNGWITSTKTGVENKELWEKLLKLLHSYGDRLAIKKVSGHSGELYNERCDELAVVSARGKNPKLFSGKLAPYQEFLEKMGTMVKPKTKKSPARTGSAYSYVSLVNGKVYVDKTWDACEKRVKGTKGAKYKKVFSKEEETELVGEYTLSTLGK